MPARKPKDLIERHETHAEKAVREARAAAVRPVKSLPVEAPARLKDHAGAAAAWRRIMRTYGEIEGEIVTRLDLDLLIDYCMLIEQLSELDTMRSAAYSAWLELHAAHTKLVKGRLFDDAVLMAIQVVGAFDAIIKLDGRADRKRDLLLKWRQSLYLTPRARAGAAPARKEPEPEKDALELLLDDVTDFVNGGGNGK